MLLFGLVVALLLMPAQSQSFGPSPYDLWDVRQGSAVTANSPVITQSGGSDIEAIFGRFPESGLERGNTLFVDSRPSGTVHFVEWRTPTPVTIRSFALMAAHDGAGANASKRGFSRFTLRAKSGQSVAFDLKVFELFPANTYGDTPEPLDSTLRARPPHELFLCVEVPELEAQDYRAEFVQVGGTVFAGPRIYELDGFSTPACGQVLKYPQIALGGGYQVVAIGSNKSDVPWSGQALLYEGSGESWGGGWTLDGADAAGSAFPVSLGPDATKKFVLRSTDPIRSGYLAFHPDPGLGIENLGISFFYNFLSGESLADSTATPAARPGLKFVFPVEFQAGVPGINTGLAWAPFQVETPFDITLQLVADDGTLFQEKTVQFEGHSDDFFTSIFDGVPDNFLGKLVVCADSAICLVALRLELVAGGGFQLTSVPADILE